MIFYIGKHDRNYYHINKQAIDLLTMFHGRVYAPGQRDHDRLIIYLANHKYTPVKAKFNFKEWCWAMLDRPKILSSEEIKGFDINRTMSKDADSRELCRSILRANFSILNMVEMYPKLYSYTNSLRANDKAISLLKVYFL